MKRALPLCLLTIVVIAPSGAQAAARKPRRITQPVAAARLVRAVTGAHTTAARAKALLEVMKATNIQVATRTGQPLSVSPETGAARQYMLYDLELTAMAGQYGRGQRETLEDISTRLLLLGVDIDATHAIPVEILRKSLVEAAQSAAKQTHLPATRVIDIIRDLGKAHGYDLAKSPPASAIKLDPVQAFLLESDLFIPFLRQVPAQSGSSVRLRSAFDSPDALTTPTASTAGLSDFCEKLDAASEAKDEALGQDSVDQLTGEAVGGGVKGFIAKQGLGFIRGQATGLVSRYVKVAGYSQVPYWARNTLNSAGANAAKILEAAKIILDGAQAVVIADSFEAKALDQLLTTHWGHAAPGKRLMFRIQVIMKDDLGDKAVKCGKLLGAEIPPPGPVSGVPVAFEQVGTQLTPADGTWDCGSVCVVKTKADGIATVTFTPKVETQLPGIGRQKTNTGNVDGAAFPAQALKSGLLSKIFQVAFLHVDGTRWEVTHHETPTLTLTYDHSLTNDYTTTQNSCSFSGSDANHIDRALEANIQLNGGSGNTKYVGVDTLRWLKAIDSRHVSGTSHYNGNCASPTCSTGEDIELTNPQSASAAVTDSSITSDGAVAHVDYLDFDPGPITATDHTEGDACGVPQDDSPNDQYLLDFGFVHNSERFVDGSRTIHITGWTPGTGVVLAQKTYSQSDPSTGNSGSYTDKFQIVESYPAG